MATVWYNRNTAWLRDTVKQTSRGKSAAAGRTRIAQPRSIPYSNSEALKLQIQWFTHARMTSPARALSQLKTIFPRYWESHVKDKMVARPSCLVQLNVRDKRRVSEIDLSQPRHETAFLWRHNGPVTSQLTDPIKWPNCSLNQSIFMCI